MSIPAQGNVLTPPGFQAMSAQGQVLLSWSQSPLATVYYVNRSTDGVVFTNIATPYTYTTGQNQQLYPLPNDFKALLGVEVALNPTDPNSWITLRKFEFVQRNLWNYPNVYTFYGITNLRYRINGNNLMIVPITQAGQTIRIWYVPRPSQLINTTDTVDGVAGWEEYIVADVCMKMLIKEESFEQAQAFALQKQALMKRIEEAAENRDIGDPEVVSDSRTRNFGWTDGSNGMGSMY
ncbi:unnamed protein product [Sphagnum jensenii]